MTCLEVSRRAPSSKPIPLVVLLFGLAAAACARAESPPPAGRAAGAPAEPAVAAAATTPTGGQKPGAAPTLRKVIRRAELGIEVTSPAAAESQVSLSIERLGGYIESSERDSAADEGERSEARVTLSLRVPAERLDEALRDLKRLGSGAETEKIGAQDVTEEYVDLEARITNQKSLEARLAALLTQTNSVESALKVHQELTTARTEIDRLEGRRRLLEKESSLATISLSLAPRRPVVGTSSSALSTSLRRAVADSVTVTAGVITFSIRAAGVLMPLAILLGLPGLCLTSWLRRRRRRLAAVGAA